VSADEIVNNFGAVPLTHLAIIIVTFAYILSYGWLTLTLIQTWRLKREVP